MKLKFELDYELKIMKKIKIKGLDRIRFYLGLLDILKIKFFDLKIFEWEQFFDLGNGNKCTTKLFAF